MKDLPPTQKQIDLILQMERVLAVRFSGSTIVQANEHIQEHMKAFSLKKRQLSLPL